MRVELSACASDSRQRALGRLAHCRQLAARLARTRCTNAPCRFKSDSRLCCTCSTELTRSQTQPYEGQKPGTSGLRKKCVGYLATATTRPAACSCLLCGSLGIAPEPAGSRSSSSPTTQRTCASAADAQRSPSQFIEAILQSVEPSAKGATLVIAGDGRFYNAVRWRSFAHADPSGMHPAHRQGA